MMTTYDPTTTYLNRSFRNIPHQIRLTRIENKIQTLCKDRKIRSYLDIGCASGFITSRIKNMLGIEQVVGTDFSKDYIHNAKVNYPAIEFTDLDLNKLSSAETVFDLVTCFETLEHVGSLNNAIENILSRIAPGGVGLLSVPIETGPVGICKFFLKSKLYGDKLNEIGTENSKQYWRTLLAGEDISVFRKPGREVWWDHFGFNFKKIEDILSGMKVSFVSQTYFTTRFITIFKSK